MVCLIVIPCFSLSLTVNQPGITIKSGDTVTKDEWYKYVDVDITLYVLGKNDNQIIGTKNFTNRYQIGPVPNAELPSTVSLVTRNMSSMIEAFTSYVFDRPTQIGLYLHNSKIKENKEAIKAATKKVVKDYDYEAACSVYKDAYESSGDFEAGINYAMMLQAMNQFDEAEAILCKLQEIQPKNRTITGIIINLKRDKGWYDTFESRKK